MKNYVKLFGIITLTAVMGFSIISCKNLKGSAVGTNHFGTTLTIFGQVYTEGTDGNIKKYTGDDLVVSSNVGKTGTINNGRLNITIGIPQTNPIMEELELLLRTDKENNYKNIQSIPAETQARVLFLGSPVFMDDDGPYRGKYNSTREERVQYIYIDRDVTVIAEGNPHEDEFCISWAIPDLRLYFKQGWNAIYIKKTYTSNTTGKYKVSLGNLSRLFWVIETDDS